jgi:hypothetical protein
MFNRLDSLVLKEKRVTLEARLQLSNFKAFKTYLYGAFITAY